jgi:hypothetical protein
VHGLRVLTKTQWRRLRNRYLNEQRKNMAAAKALLRKSRPHQVKPQHYGKMEETGGGESSSTVAADSLGDSKGGVVTTAVESKTKCSEKSQSYTPGVIVKVIVEAGKLIC